jgi:hypothetical protein
VPLQVAPCPRCRGAIVFGERQCRACEQPFDYGASPPSLPPPQQVWEALAAVGQIPAEPAAAQALAHAIQQSYTRFSSVVAAAAASQAAPAGAVTSAERSVPQLADLDTGRFESPGVVATQDVPGLVDSTLFAAFTPKDIQVALIPGLEQTGQAPTGEVRVVPTVDVERAAVDVGEVQVQRVPDIFHSDFMKAPEGVQTQRLDIIDSSPSAVADRGRTATRDAARKAAEKSAGQLNKVLCRCGETHRLPRCPSCGTEHPELA